MEKKQELTGITKIIMEEARCLINQDNYEEVLTKLQSCLQDESKLNSGWFILNELGYCYLRLGWFKEAVEAFDQYLKDNPSDADARFFRASAYASLQWTDEAIKELRIILDSDSTDVLARHELALCYRDKGWIKEALIEMKKANDSAKIYGNPEEQRIVASSLMHLEDETDNENDRLNAALLIFIILLMKMKLKIKVTKSHFK